VTLILVAAIIFTVGTVLVVLERPGLSRAGFALECVGAVIATVSLLL